MSRGVGSIQKKILILLAGHLSAGLTYSPRQRARVFREMDRELARVDEESVRRSIQALYQNNLIDFQENNDGTITLKLLDKGKERILRYEPDKLKIKPPKKWDGRWRMVLFDIPNKDKKARDVLRFHLKRLGFYQYQKSVFIHPYECKDEIDFLVEFYQLKPYVRQMAVSYIDNDLHLRKIFKDLIGQFE